MSNKDLIKSGLEGVQEKINVEIDKTFGDKAPEIKQFLVRFAEDNSLSLPDELKDEKKLFEVIKLADLIEFRATADGFSIVTEDGTSLVTEDGHSLITETTCPELIGIELIKIGGLLSARTTEIENKTEGRAGGRKGSATRHATSRKFKPLVVRMYKSGDYGEVKLRASSKIRDKILRLHKEDIPERRIQNWLNKVKITHTP